MLAMNQLVRKTHFVPPPKPAKRVYFSKTHHFSHDPIFLLAFPKASTEEQISGSALHLGWLVSGPLWSMIADS